MSCRCREGRLEPRDGTRSHGARPGTGTARWAHVMSGRVAGEGSRRERQGLRPQGEPLRSCCRHGRRGPRAGHEAGRPRMPHN